MTKTVEELELKGTVDTCPQCGYKDGFHVSFAVKGAAAEIVLICPNCSARYATGWTRAVGTEAS